LMRYNGVDNCRKKNRVTKKIRKTTCILHLSFLCLLVGLFHTLPPIFFGKGNAKEEILIPCHPLFFKKLIFIKKLFLM